ncbi:MAG: NlpC/P60 family protein [Pararhodobacter sp.]
MSRDVAALARQWLGTPYVAGASVQGAGCDCLGLVRGLWRALYGAEPERVPPYGPGWADLASGEPLGAALARHMTVVAPGTVMAPGEVLLFRLRARGAASHLGVLVTVGAAPRFVHAWERHGVVESALSGPWARRVAGRFRMPPAGFAASGNR